MNFIFRILYRLDRVVSWLRHWTRRRFTRSGLALLGAFVVAGMVGFDTENTVAYQAFTLLVCLLFAAMVCGGFFRVRFSATRLLPRFGTVGHPFSYRIVVKNLTSKVQSGLTLLDDLADPRPSFPEWLAVERAREHQYRPFRFSRRRAANSFARATVKEAAVLPVPAHQETEVSLLLTPLRRGVLRFIGTTLARSDPLGLFRGLAKVPLPQTALILPKRYPLPPIGLPGAMKYHPGGVALASNVGRSDEFVSLREYRRGDPLRHIHWRSWAKTGKPIVKEFEDEFFVRHALVLDTFTDRPHGDEFEEAVSVAASFACTIQTQESLLDLLFVGPEAYCFTAGRGLAHGDQLLEILASVRACPDVSAFRTLEHLVLDHIAVVSGCICVLLAWDDKRRKLVEKIKVLGVPVLVLVVTPPGQGKSLEPGPMRDEPHRLHALEVGRIEEGLAQLP